VFGKKYSLFNETIKSFDKLYPNTHEYEIVLAIDSKMHDSFPQDTKMFIDNHRCLIVNNDGYNPVKLYNKAAEQARGDYLILTSPEIKHLTNVLSGLDRHFEEDKDAYVVCACKERHGWLQHTRYNNRMLHFCSAISKENYIKLGGFDENYSKGISYDDDDFLMKVKHAGLRIVCDDSMVTEHQEHSRDYIFNSPSLVKINQQYFMSKWNCHTSS
jgi:hypothetical protein